MGRPFTVTGPSPASTLPLAAIAARDRAQAMDWSLVLASQEIGATILAPVEGDAHWRLMVEPFELNRAQSAIFQYERENRAWRWGHSLRWDGLVFEWTGLAWCVLLAVFHFLATGPLPALTERGVMDDVAFKAGEWWRLFTAVMLHADYRHLAANLTTGVLLLGLALGRYGIGLGLLLAYLAGALGNLGSVALYPWHYHGLGASGMIMGALGLLTVQSVYYWRSSPRAARRIAGAIIGGLMLFLLLGSNPASDLVAHAGGFLAGGAFGILLHRVPPQRLHRNWIEFASGTALLSLILGTWWLALH